MSLRSVLDRGAKSGRRAEDGRSGISFRAERASHELRKADELSRREPRDFVDAQFNRIEATEARVEGERLLKLPGALVGSPETELVPPIDPRDSPSAARLNYVSDYFPMPPRLGAGLGAAAAAASASVYTQPVSTM